MAVYLYDYIVYIEGGAEYWSIDNEVATLVATRYETDRPPQRLTALKCNALNKALFEARRV